jgi:hypothetical protein
MRYGVVMANVQEYSDPRVAVRLAQAAEVAGWPSSCGTTSASRVAALVRHFLGHVARRGGLHHPPYAGNGHHAVVRRSHV